MVFDYNVHGPVRSRPRRDEILSGTTTQSRVEPTASRVSRAIARPGRLRTLILAVLCFGMIGTSAELILLEHTEDTFQWVPLILLGVGFVVTLAFALRANRSMLRMFQALMLVFIASGILGVYLHYKGNVEFELEMYPSMSGLKLVWEALRGATPSLAPGTMALFGLIGLTTTYEHPAARSGRAGIPPEEVS